MTREEAIRNINALNAVCGQKDFYDKEFEEALEMAIKALEQEPCGDCVSRADYLNVLHEWEGKITESPFCFKQLIIDLFCLPPVQPKAKTGEWISANDMLPSDCDCDWVLAQIQEDNGYMWIPCVAEYRKDKDDWLCEEHNVGWLKDHNGAFKVIAWMPLPPIYKAESEE